MNIYSNQKSGIAISNINGLSPDIPVVLQNSFSNGYTLPTTSVNTAVEDAIIDKVKAGNLQKYQFPIADFPKYNFTLIENDVNIGGRGALTRLTPQKIYKFPLPDPMVDLFSVQYKTDFSYLNNPVTAAAGAAAFAALSRNPIIAAIIGLTAAVTVGPGLATGALKVNTFKTVTLDSPYFRQFELNWKFIPRNYTEARLIQSIITSLKRGSAPRFAELGIDAPGGLLGTGINTVPGLFRFPKVYTMFFQPNVQFLYKFKPAVLRTISIHYDGGSGAPTFYRPENGVVSNSPVESVVINTNWLEIEYWAYDNYKDDPNTEGMPSPNPLDAINDGRYIPESELFNPIGSGGEARGPGNVIGQETNPEFNPQDFFPR